MARPGEDTSSVRRAAEAESRRLWRLAGMGGTLVSEILGGTLLGWLLDYAFGTKPTLLIVFTVFGVIVGMTTFIRGALAQSRSTGSESSDSRRRFP